MTRDTAPLALPESEGLRLSRVAAPLLERLGRLLGSCAFVALAIGIYTLTRPRQYEAATSLITVSARPTSVTASLPVSLLAGLNAGLQPTPALIAKLATARGVVGDVARRKVDVRHDSAIYQLVDPRLRTGAPEYKAYQSVTRAFSVTTDRETGLVTLTVAHRDSALARLLASALVDQVTIAFRRAAQSQASELRQAQEVRVDSAARRLRRAEDALAGFDARNRVVADFSTAAVDRQRLSRTLSIATTVYTQAVSDREAAVAKELEETPAVVIVDPIPRELVPRARGTVTITAATFIGALVLGVFAIVTLDFLRERGSTRDRERERIATALDRARWLRALSGHRASRAPAA